MKKFLLLSLLVLLPLSASAYTIKKGDTLYGLYGANWSVVAKSNNISDPTKLKVGQVIVSGKPETQLGAFFQPAAQTYPLFSAVTPIVTPGIATSTGTNTMGNGNLESLTNGFPTTWASTTLQGNPTFTVTSTAQSGNNAMVIGSTQSDTGAFSAISSSGLTPGALYLVQGYGRTATSADGVSAMAIFNGQNTSSTQPTQIWNIASSTWETFSSWGQIFNNASNYLAFQSNSSTSWQQMDATTTVPANGSISVTVINAPNRNNTSSIVLVDNFSIAPFTPGSPTTTQRVDIFKSSSAVDPSTLTTDSKVVRFNTTGGTPADWFAILPNHKMVLYSPNAAVCGYLEVTNGGAFNSTTSTCP